MKRSLILFFVLIIAALSVLSVSAAPRDRYYDQMGNKHWCNSDSYGCWITGENGEHEYIMFWSEAARDSIMGPDSKAPLGTNPGTSELPLLPPKPAKTTSGGGTIQCDDKQYQSEKKDCDNQCSGNVNVKSFSCTNTDASASSPCGCTCTCK